MDKDYEIRQILLGRAVQTENGSLSAPKPGEHVLFQGMVNGWGSVRFLGLTRRTRRYRMGGKISFHLAAKILNGMGRRVELSGAEQVSACLCQSPMASPALMTVEQEGDCWNVTAFTGRSPMAALNCRRLLNRFESGLPKGAERVETQRAAGANKTTSKHLNRKRERKERNG